MSEQREKAIELIFEATGGLVSKSTIEYLDKFPHDCKTDTERIVTSFVPHIELLLAEQQKTEMMTYVLQNLVSADDTATSPGDFALLTDPIVAAARALLAPKDAEGTESK